MIMNRGYVGFAGIEVWRSSDPLDPIKPKAAGVVWVNNSLVILFFNSHWGQRGCYPGGKLRVY